MGIPRLRASVSACALVASLVVSAAPAARAATLPPSEWVVGPLSKTAFITFDGPARPKHFKAVAEILDNRKARASFFIPGAWIDRNRRHARRLANAGHFLGNRGHADVRFTSLDDSALRASISRAQQAITRVTSAPAPFLRPPQGARDLRVLRVAGSMGYRSLRWTHRPGGGEAARVQRAVLRKAKLGSIISLDPSRVAHRVALGGIIEGLRKRGYALATVKRMQNVHPVRWDLTLKAGSSGPAVAHLQNTLKKQTYPAGATDGSFGYATLQAVYAYEKTRRLTRDGVVTPAQMTKIALDRRPRAPKRKYRNFIDIDISRQVLFEVREERVIHTIPVSTGNEEYYEVDGQRYKAHTPRGDFNITRKIKGKRVSRLGTLYWPSYFVGGYAIHGSDSVPTHPASHGCVRIPRYVERAFWYRNPVGRPVFVHD